jgi:hypothetical protein
MMVLVHRGLRTGEQHKVVAKLNEMGVNITISTLDVANIDEARQLIDLAEGQAPLAIIFHLAMVLDDRLLMKQVGFRGQPLTSAGHVLDMGRTSCASVHLARVQPTNHRAVDGSQRELSCSYRMVRAGTGAYVQRHWVHGI